MKRLQYDQLAGAIKDSKILLVQGPKNAGKGELIRSILEEQKSQFSVINCSKKTDLLSGLKSTESNTVLILNAHLSADLQQVVEMALNEEIRKSLILECSFRPVLDELLLEVLDANGMLITIYTPSFYEAAQHFGIAEESKLLEERLIFGNYLQVLSDVEHAELTLRELVQDIVITHFGPKDRVNKGDKLVRVMVQLAFAIGEPISYNEIGERVDLDNETVERYVKLLEDAFILICLPAYSSGKRYELKKSFCFYFADSGIRNVLINNLNPTFMRNDMRELWRNYLVSERLKWITMNRIDSSLWFWRSHTKQQIDILEVGTELNAYKTDWEKRGKVKVPELFKEYYPEARNGVLNKNTYWTYLSKKK